MFPWHTWAFLLTSIWFAFIIFAKPFFAAAPSITSFPTTVDLDSSFNIVATMSGLTNNAIYRLRIVFAPSGTFNYFGSTWNGTSWYNGTPSPITYSNFFTATMDGTGAWGGTLQGKVESDDSNFTTGGGTYDVKVGRYTQTGSTATWSNIVAVTLNVPPTPTPTNTPTPTPSKSPTATPTPSPTPTPVVSITVTSVASATATPVASVSSEILGESTSTLPGAFVFSPTPFSKEKETKVLGINQSTMPMVLLGLGISLILASCGILAFKIKKKNQKFLDKNFLE